MPPSRLNKCWLEPLPRNGALLRAHETRSAPALLPGSSAGDGRDRQAGVCPQLAHLFPKLVPYWAPSGTGLSSLLQCASPVPSLAQTTPLDSRPMVGVKACLPALSPAPSSSLCKTCPDHPPWQPSPAAHRTSCPVTNVSVDKVTHGSQGTAGGGGGPGASTQEGCPGGKLRHRSAKPLINKNTSNASATRTRTGRCCRTNQFLVCKALSFEAIPKGLKTPPATWISPLPSCDTNGDTLSPAVPF